MRALVVDDDSSVVDFIVTILRSESIAPDVAQDGAEAAFWLRNLRYEHLFLDLDLPIASGSTLIRMMREGELPTPPNVVLITATPHLLVERFHGIVLAKPFSAAHVRAVVSRVLAPATTIS